MSHKTAGLYRYEVRADALPGEVTTVNNTAPLLLRVVDQPVRVLLLEGKPYWDTKFLVRTFVGRSVGRVDQRGAIGRGAAAGATNPRQPQAEGERRNRRPRDPAAEATDTKGPTRRLSSGRSRNRSPARTAIASSGPSRRTPGNSSPTPTALASYQIVILGRNAGNLPHR